MKIFLRSAFIAIAFMFVFGNLAATKAPAQGRLREVLKRMGDRYKTLTTLRARFTMGRQNAQLGDDPEIQLGTAIYAKRSIKDALLRVDWTTSLQGTLSVVDGRYTLYRKRLGMAYKGSVKDKTRDSKDSSAFAFMNMTKAQLLANYDIKYFGTATLSDGTPTVQLELTPKAKTVFRSADLWIDKDGMPRQSKFTETNNDTTQVLLSLLEPNIKLNSSDFIVALPKGTPIISAPNVQKHFRLNNASKTVDVGIDVGTCEMGDRGLCSPLFVTFYRKGAATPFQSIRLAKTEMWDPVPKANVINLYDDQSVINFGDFNFDGVEDVAICDGSNGGYGSPSYQVYLYSVSESRFLPSPSFTRLVQGVNLGMFVTDKKKKMHYVYSKSGCCWHQTEGYDVFKGQPRKVYEFTEDAMIGDGLVRVSTKKLIRARWRVQTKSYKESTYYQKPKKSK